MAKKSEQSEAEVKHPRTSGGPEAYAGPITPSTQQDREAALQHAERHLKMQAQISPPEQQHSMRRVEMQAAGISDEALVLCDRVGVSREVLLANPELAQAAEEFQAKVREAAHKA